MGPGRVVAEEVCSALVHGLGGDLGGIATSSAAALCRVVKGGVEVESVGDFIPVLHLGQEWMVGGGARCI